MHILYARLQMLPARYEMLNVEHDVEDVIVDLGYVSVFPLM
jgi:hypothetical protein